jgi:hypothetical protein
MRPLRIAAIGAVILAAAALLGHEVVPHGHDAHAQQVGACDHHDASRWHAPYEWDLSTSTGCLYGHEHGDAPPAWIAEAGYAAGFDHAGGFHGNTSHLENTEKHAAMKGFLADFTDYGGGTQQVYFRVHIATNALDRTARYHSYEVFMRDATGAVSHWQGWFNSGDPSADRFLYNGRNDPGRRPIVLTQDETTFAVVKNEHWYTRASAAWNWDFAWTVDATTFWRPDEAYDPNPANWPATGRLGTVRRLEPAWYGPDSRVSPNRGRPPRGVAFYATPFGEIVSGPDDPRCAPYSCLRQFIAPTARAVEAGIPGGNPRERVFPGIGLGVRLPN